MRYPHARVLVLSAKARTCAPIAEALSLHVDMGRHLIDASNQEGLEPVTPEPRSRRRLPTHAPTLKRWQGTCRINFPSEKRLATWFLQPLAWAVYDQFIHLPAIRREL